MFPRGQNSPVVIHASSTQHRSSSIESSASENEKEDTNEKLIKMTQNSRWIPLNYISLEEYFLPSFCPLLFCCCLLDSSLDVRSVCCRLAPWSRKRKQTRRLTENKNYKNSQDFNSWNEKLLLNFFFRSKFLVPLASNWEYSKSSSRHCFMQLIISTRRKTQTRQKMKIKNRTKQSAVSSVQWMSPAPF